MYIVQCTITKTLYYASYRNYTLYTIQYTLYTIQYAICATVDYHI